MDNLGGKYVAVIYVSVTHIIFSSRLNTERIKRILEIMYRTKLKPRLLYIEAWVSELLSMNMYPPASYGCGSVVGRTVGEQWVLR